LSNLASLQDSLQQQLQELQESSSRELQQVQQQAQALQQKVQAQELEIYNTTYALHNAQVKLAWGAVLAVKHCSHTCSSSTTCAGSRSCTWLSAASQRMLVHCRSGSVSYSTALA
jgi:hypothetical protein